MKYKKIQDFIGNTPLVEIPKELHKTNNILFAKVEYFNPAHSLKDRIETFMIEQRKKTFNKR